MRPLAVISRWEVACDNQRVTVPSLDLEKKIYALILITVVPRLL